MVIKFNINDELNTFHTLRPANLQNTETILKSNINKPTFKDESQPAVEPTNESQPAVEPTNESDFIYSGLINNCNKCWENSTLQSLFYLNDYKESVLNIINDSEYSDELKKKLNIINNSTFSSSLNEVLELPKILDILS
jgi:uncharacterized UBP type Zn finger protein